MAARAMRLLRRPRGHAAHRTLLAWATNSAAANDPSPASDTGASWSAAQTR
jgi:hypothetical protein